MKTNFKLKKEQYVQIISQNGMSGEIVLSKEEYNRIIDKVRDELLAISPSFRQYQHAITYLRKVITAANDQYGSTYVIPASQISLSLPQPFWTKKEVRLGLAIHHFDNKFNEKFLNLDGVEDAETLLGLFLYSAIANGGLIGQGVIIELAKQTSKRTRIICISRSSKKTLGYERHFYAWIDLTLKKSKGYYNMKQLQGEEEKFLFQPWFIDIISLKVLQKYLSLSPSDIKLTRPEDIFKLISKALSIGPKDTQVQSLDGLFKAAKYKVYTDKRTGIGYGLLCCATQQVKSFFMDPISWENFTNPILRKVSLDVEPLNNKRSIQAMKRKRPSLKAFKHHSNELKKVFKIHNLPVYKHEEIRPILKSRLENYREENIDLPSSVTLLVDWYIEHIDELATSSLKTYHHTLHTRWFDNFYDKNLEELSADVFFEIFESIIEDYSQKNAEEKTKNADGSISRLKSLFYRLYNFGREKLELPYIPELESYRSGLTSHYIKAKILSPVHFNHAIDVIDNIMVKGRKPGPIFIRQLKLILVLGFRCGLRIGEILKLERQNFSVETGYLNILKTKYGSNKTPSALRKVFLRKTMKMWEYNFFLSYYHDMEKRLSPKAPLFGEDGTDVLVDRNHYSQILNTVLKQVTGDPDFTFHSLRHTYATTIYCLGEGSYYHAEVFSGLDEFELKALRYSIIGGPKRKRDTYWCIAKALGHSSPEEMLRTYAHAWPLLLQHKLEYAHRDFLDRNVPFSWFSPSRERYLSASGCDLMKKVTDSLPPEYKNEVVRKAPKVEEDDTGGWDYEQMLSVVLYQAVLKDHDKGLTSEQLVEQYAIPKVKLDRLLRNAATFTTITTSENQAKFITQGKADRNTTNHAPQPPKSPIAFSIANKIINQLKVVMTNDLNCFKQFVMEILKGYSANASKIYIYHPETLRLIVETIHDVVPYNRWEVHLKVPETIDGRFGIEVWKEAVSDYIHFPNPQTTKFTRGKSCFGRAEINFDHLEPARNSDTKRKSGRSILLYVAHMIAIMTFRDDDFKELRDD